MSNKQKVQVAEAPAVRVQKTEKERDMQMVRGRFRCFEPPGGSVKLSYRRYAEEPIRTYQFQDQKEYEIPYGLAKHLRENCAYFKHAHIVDQNGVPIVDQQAKRVDRMSFEPLGFGIDGEF